MGRIISTQGPGKERQYYLKQIALALRELAQMSSINKDTKDLVAYIALLLYSVSKTIDKTVQPWEKRDYWVKADAFRREWEWSYLYSKQLRAALVNDDWETIALITANIASKLKGIKIPKNASSKVNCRNSYKLLTNEKEW